MKLKVATINGQVFLEALPVLADIRRIQADWFQAGHSDAAKALGYVASEIERLINDPQGTNPNDPLHAAQ